MSFRDLTFNEVERLRTGPGQTDEALQMDQDTFRALYDRTARPLWVFLWRRTGDRQIADDLLQETYYRFLRTRGRYESEAHRRNYLFRIATNLANDRYRRRHNEHVPLSISDTDPEVSDGSDIAGGSDRRRDVTRALSQLTSHQRDALWLAYVEGLSHEEISEVLGMKTASIKILLYRARRKMIQLLKGHKR